MSDQPRPDPSPPGGDRPSHPSLAAELSATAHRVEHAVEETLEHGIEVAEQTIVRRFGIGALRAVRTTLRLVFWSLVAAYFAFGALLLVTRYYVLPRIDQWRPQIEEIASRALKGTVTMARIEAGWRGFNPHLSLDDVQVTGPHGGPPLALPRVDATVSWLSLVRMEPRFVALRLLTPEVSIVRLADGSFTVAGFVITPGKAESEESAALEWLLAQDQVVLRDGHVAYRDERTDEPSELDLNDVNLIVEQSLGSHTFALQARPTAEFAGPIDVRGTMATGAFARRSDVGRWKGQVFVQLDFVDLAWLSRLVAMPVPIEQAYGALRVWGVAPAYAALECAQSVSDDIVRLAGSMQAPFCGSNVGFEAAGWMADDPAAIRSLAMIPLRVGGDSRAFGLLALGSPDPDRFHITMGTAFLARIGELASAALARLRA